MYDYTLKVEPWGPMGFNVSTTSLVLNSKSKTLIASVYFEKQFFTDSEEIRVKIKERLAVMILKGLSENGFVFDKIKRCNDISYTIKLVCLVLGTETENLKVNEYFQFKGELSVTDSEIGELISIPRKAL